MSSTKSTSAMAEATPGVCGLRLYVERENTGAQATYRALGMEETHYKLFEQLTRPAPWAR